jgi:hypothetical protein
MCRFTIRDGLWLMVALVLGCAWFLHHSAWRTLHENEVYQLDRQRRQELFDHYQQLEKIQTRASELKGIERATQKSGTGTLPAAEQGIYLPVYYPPPQDPNLG